MVMVEVMMMMLFLFGFIIPLFLFGAYADVFSCMAFYMHACFLDAVWLIMCNNRYVREINGAGKGVFVALLLYRTE